MSVRTLYGAEYLLFHDGVDNGCAPDATINASGSWAGLGATELASRRAAYAHAIAADVLTRERALLDAWEPGKGDFLGNR